GRHQAAAATIAALSVHIERLGRKPWTPSSTQADRNRSRSSELAATPPPKARPLAPTCWAARRALATSTSTTASWKLAATSAVAASGCLRTWLITDVLSPENEKSSPSTYMARGNGRSAERRVGRGGGCRAGAG